MDATSVRVIDSHTEGEPTRVVLAGGPTVPSLPPIEARRWLAEHHDAFRAALIGEPRGYEAIVGAMLLPPQSEDACAGVVFFNNAGWLAMCVHGTIGLLQTLRHDRGLPCGTYRLETPAGPVFAELLDEHRVRVTNVRSYVLTLDVVLDVPGVGHVRGDVAWGGNWFFLVREPSFEIDLSRVESLRAACRAIRRALATRSIRGVDDAEVDHIVLFGPSAKGDARNFVLCPGGAYDRSPCGTGTSADLACRWARGECRPGTHWNQESVTGSMFEATFEAEEEAIVPSVTGRAFITAETRFWFDSLDPMGWHV